ncbi:C-type lectin 37Db [Sitodiplosis mosellana]|uniref:C-type lectin 37Db n=1 Tax=Sitodiplosis mosellana TaxID=263140 RepID=UPI002444343B|nr:C-type lectin 37Db [Sitodiplosis mosellana]
MKLLVFNIFLLTVAAVFGQTFYPKHRVIKKYHLMTLAPVNWFRALHHCRFLGMNLASITSLEENNQIIQQIKIEGHERKHFWLSGTKLGFNDGYHWMGNGKTLTFTNWGGLQPDNLPNEDCLQIWNVGDGPIDDSMWNDRNCSHDLYFICEEEKIEYEYCSS